jgi:hypothetical protein
MKKEDVELFEKTNAQLMAVYEEITALSKKSPNDGVNKFKLKLINKVLQDANAVLDEKHKPFPDFFVFIEEELPSNSDVVFILAQYLNCIENLRAKNIGQKEYDNTWYWIINGKVSSEITSPPKKVKER